MALEAAIFTLIFFVVVGIFIIYALTNWIEKWRTKFTKLQIIVILRMQLEIFNPPTTLFDL